MFKAKSLTGIAKVATGKVSDFRKVLDLNPGLSPFKYPPQIQAGIKVASVFGIKVPTEQELIGLANGKIQTVLGSLKRPLEQAITVVEGKLQTVTKAAGTVEEVLNKIDWLL